MSLNKIGASALAGSLLIIGACQSRATFPEESTGVGSATTTVTPPSAEIATSAAPAPAISGTDAAASPASASADPALTPTAVAPAASQAPAATPSSAPPAADAVAKGDTILLPGNIVFESGKAILEATPGNEEVLGQIRRYLEKNPNVTVMRIEGHTDNVGSAEANLKLSGERALAIKLGLVARGVSPDRLLAVGFGSKKPIADNATEGGRAQNRRTEFKIAVLFGKPYRGLNPLGSGTEFK
jgi:OmpA-OmpF porin, OOP family